MEMAVKPGRVLISLTKMRLVPRSRKKSQRAKPAAPMALKAATPRRRTSSAFSFGSFAGMIVWALPSAYLSS
jgi:hypothetical protein